MKVLGNPWAVGALCVVAAGVIGYQFLPARRPAVSAAGPGSPAPLPAAMAAPSLPAAPATSSSSKPAPAPATLLDRSSLRAHLAEWMESPRRDPFLLLLAADKGAAAASPLAHWRLKAVWNQTGGRFAAINDSVYAEGDKVGDYQLETIERDRVWLRGPAGRESLSFTNLLPGAVSPAATNTPAIK